MSDFEFFFSFYGLLLGLSVAELTGGFARLLHERHRVRFGWLTPLLALFVAIDLVTFWVQAWFYFRGAPFNAAVLLVGLVIAATFYIAASLTFPRVLAEGAETPIDLDAHFWAHRRVVFGCVLAANAPVWLIVGLMPLANEAWLEIWSARLIIGISIFATCTAAAAFSRSRTVVVAALLGVLGYTLYNFSRAGVALVKSGLWGPSVG